MMFGFFFIPLVIIGAFAYALGWRPQISQGKPPDQTPLDILKARYARGEISRDEFDLARKALGG